MNNINDIETLELVESYVENEHGTESFFSSEKALSEEFDRMIEEDGLIETLSEDEPMLNETFNNWSDSLCRSGRLHDEQYSNYCYCGKFA